MKITCPHCSFAREVPDAQIPDRPVKVTCPKCQQGFSFDKTAAAAASAFDADFTVDPVPAAAAAAPDLVACPACGLKQPAGEACSGCGVIYAKWAARHEAREQAPPPPPQSEAAFPGRAAYTAAAGPAELPKAGFWLRFVACMIDTLLLGAVQFVIGLVLGIAGGAAGDFEGGETFAMLAITWLCSMAVSVTYYVFFTGYNGQTPGKMALRIQVVRTDGTPMSYGRAFLREIVGKFVSALILCIGYLMVAFDQQKQGLHDRIAGTYVIKL
ncbi:MAG: zinc-ribbon domain-containing protein [Desulfuromonadales bacterium]|nr:zinc-ribbon domain-containing protein [Desulfuromonadales bacterium]